MIHLQYPVKPGGYVFIDGVEQSTLQCVHCGRHWIYEPGEGTYRGVCMNCMGPTCGCKACSTCVPYLKTVGR